MVDVLGDEAQPGRHPLEDGQERLAVGFPRRGESDHRVTSTSPSIPRGGRGGSGIALHRLPSSGRGGGGAGVAQNTKPGLWPGLDVQGNGHHYGTPPAHRLAGKGFVIPGSTTVTTPLTVTPISSCSPDGSRATRSGPITGSRMGMLAILLDWY